MAVEVGLSVGEKIAGCLIEPIQRELGYLFCFNSNIQELETQLSQLTATRNDVQAREDAEQSCWKTLGDAAKLWMDEANGKIAEAETVISDKAELQKGCFSIKWCPNLKLRFSLGRKGKKLSLVLIELLQRADKLPQTGVALPMAPPINMSDYNGGASDLDSRRKPMEDMIELLLDKETRLIGICGMGGLGKTTFAKQVLQKVRDSHKHLFDFQVISTVSSNPNFNTIQQEVVEMLGGSSLKEIDSEILRAERLRSTFKGKKVVVLLDDVWKEFDLNQKGFPLSNSDVCCKIIYTSRNKGMWSREGTIKKKEIPLDVLSDKESLDLFIREANLNNDDADFQKKHEIAISIVNECKGLPLALKVAGGALLQNNIYQWDDYLLRLQNHDQHLDKITMVLAASYGFLEDPNLKLLFLLCCIFPEDQEIPIETLYRYVAGLQLFQGIKDLKHVRNRVYTLVDDLIRKSLIMNVESLIYQDGRVVKMHDVVRDVGLAIGKEHEKGFSSLMHNDETDLKKDISEDIKIISILFQNGNQIDFHLDRTNFGGSKLELLCLNNRGYSSIIIPVDFFQMKNNLKVLVLEGIRNPEFSYISSFLYLVNLKMLSLEGMNLITAKDLFIIGHLKELEILSLRGSAIDVLPNEISELTNLRWLDLTECECFIKKGILSKLTNLQKLYMWNSFADWWVPKQQSSQSTRDGNDNTSAAKLIELSHLNKLWRLELVLSNIEQVQRGVKLLSSFKSLEYFKIRIGRKRDIHPFKSGDRQLVLKDINDNFSDELGDIIKNNITNICLYNSSVIWENLHLKEFLKDIVLEDCESITTLVQPSQSLSQHTSDGLGRGREKHKIPNQLNSLETLMLHGLCRLESFCKGINEIHFDKLKRMELKRLKKFIFPTKLIIPCLKELIIESIPNLKSLCNLCAPFLEELEILNCEALVYLFSANSAMQENISHISKLQIQKCEKLKGIIFISTDDLEEEGTKLFSFSNLQVLKLESLDELVSFVINKSGGEKMQNALFYSDQVSFPCLREVEIRELPKIIDIVGCHNRLQHHDTENNGEEQNILFHHQMKLPCLENLYIESIQNLKSLYNFSSPLLKELTIEYCENLVYLFSASSSAMPKNISHISKLQIQKCKNLKGIIFISTGDLEEEGTKSFSFSNLQVLKLEFLDELVSFVINQREGEKMQNALFYSDQVSFPYLRVLEIRGLPKIIDIVGCHNRLQHHDIENNGEEQNTLFHHQVNQMKLSCLKILDIESIPNLKSLCNLNAPFLKELTIEYCENLVYLFSASSAMQENISYISILHIERCNNLKGIIFISTDDLKEEGIKSFSFSNLQILSLKFLDELVSFVINKSEGEKMQNALFYSDQVSFPCLRVLKIKELPKINFIVGYHNRLQHHDIENNGEKQNTLFHHRQMKLPCLEWLDIESIPNLKNLCNFSAPFLQELKIRFCEDLVYLFSATSAMKENISHLSKLYIEGCKKCKAIIFILTHPEEKGNESFSFFNLEVLHLKSLDELASFVVSENEKENVQSALFYHNQVSFPCLKGLTIWRLPKINYIVGWNDLKKDNYNNSEIHQPMLPNLSYLHLHSLMELVSFLGVFNYNMEDNGKKQNTLFPSQVSFPCLTILPSLTSLRVEGLPKINYIVGRNGLHQQGHDNESRLEPQILLIPILDDLYLNDLSNLVHIYESNHPELGVFLFQNLSKLIISVCEKLKYLFSKRIARDAAKHLKTLSIHECPMVEVVMKKDEDEYDDNILGGGECISLPNYNHFFPSLETLQLYRLPELKRFCDIADSWALSSLDNLCVKSCPKLKAFSPGCLNSPKLKTLLYNNTEVPFSGGDINNTLCHLFNRVGDDGDGEDDGRDDDVLC